MRTRSDCYVDTSALIALLDRSDKDHRIFKSLFSEPPPLLTSSLVIAEGHGWFLRKYNGGRAAQFLAFIRELPGLTMESFDSTALSDAIAITAKFPDQKLTLADAHGLSIMKEYSVKSCWSTDRHMGLTGVPLAIRQIS